MWKTKIATKSKGNKQKTVTNVVYINPTILITNLNVSGLNTTIRRQRLSEWKKKTRIHVVYMKPTS